MKLKQFNIFRRGSTTYFYSSIFFPKSVRDDVFTLYAFVRIADDYVDSIPQKKKDFAKFKNEYLNSIKRGYSKNEIINDFIALVNKRSIPNEWVVAFLNSMELDLKKKNYKTMNELERYMYGSANVIGLIMAVIMNLDATLYPSAELLGKSFQYVNFIRDVEEDNSLGRTYIPSRELKKYGLTSLSKEEVSQKKTQFITCIRSQIMQYEVWKNQAVIDFKRIPKRYRIPIQTANDMYSLTAKRIAEDPMIVFKKKVKPSRIMVLIAALRNAYNAYT